MKISLKMGCPHRCRRGDDIGLKTQRLNSTTICSRASLILYRWVKRVLEFSQCCNGMGATLNEESYWVTVKDGRIRGRLADLCSLLVQRHEAHFRGCGQILCSGVGAVVRKRRAKMLHLECRRFSKNEENCLLTD